MADIKRRLFIVGKRVGEELSLQIRERPNASSTNLLVGSGRSDITWLASVLSASPGVQQIFEPLNPVWIKEAPEIRSQNQLSETFEQYNCR